MAKLFTNSVIHPVYFMAGKSAADGKSLYRRAPFDVVNIDGKVFIQPRSMGGTDSALAVFGYGGPEDISLWRQDMGGYETLEPIVVDECQMGDGSDNWIGLNAISNI